MTGTNTLIHSGKHGVFLGRILNITKIGKDTHTYTLSGKHGVFLGRTLNIIRIGNSSHTHSQENMGFS